MNKKDLEEYLSKDPLEEEWEFERKKRILWKKANFVVTALLIFCAIIYAIGSIINYAIEGIKMLFH